MRRWRWQREYNPTLMKLVFVAFATENIRWVFRDRGLGDFGGARWDLFWALFWFYEFMREWRRPTIHLELRHKWLIGGMGLILLVSVAGKVMSVVMPN